MAITSFLFAQDTVDRLDDLNKDLDEIKKELLKDAGGGVVKDAAPVEDNKRKAVEDEL